ncbi:hypothetical protein ACFQ1L_32180 [Phytohabitans flavus]
MIVPERYNMAVDVLADRDPHAVAMLWADHQGLGGPSPGPS